MRSRLLALVPVVLALSTAARADGPVAKADAPVAKAEETAPPEPAWETAPPTRRAGFSVGVEVGFGVGSIVGYPNDVKKEGLARYYSSTGVRPGSVGILWLGGAMTDWFNFGLG